MQPAMVRTRRATTVFPLRSTGGERRHRRVRLSPLDMRLVGLPPICLIYLFPAAAEVPFSDIVRTLSSSLAAVLSAFHPFAGEVVYSPEQRTVEIICGEDAGAAFVESETDLDFATLVADLDLDEDALLQLVPDFIRREQLPAPVFAAQVTEFVGASGGIALGVAFDHVATDGIGISRFMEMWAALAVDAGASSDWPEPLHDRRLVRFDGDEELAGRVLRLVAPDLPRIVPTTTQCQLLVSRRTFTFSGQALGRLKQRLISNRPDQFDGAAPPSTFATLAAHAWVCLALASGFTDAAPVFAGFLSDCRARRMSSSPPVPDAYVGNCIVPCTVVLSGEELAGADGPALAFMAIRHAVTKVKQEPLHVVDIIGSMSKTRAIPPGRMLLIGGSPWLPVYVDFGFGRPSRVEEAPLNEDGMMMIYAGKEPGSVQATVAVAAWKMPAFRRMFEVVESGCNKARL